MVFESKEIKDSYICFNDEAGNWYNKNELFYVRASIIINTLQIKKIEQEILEIKNKLDLQNLDYEIKWQDLWILRRNFKQNITPKDRRLSQIYTSLKNKNKDYHLLIDYCTNIHSLIKKYNLIIIATFSSKNFNHKEEDIIKFHIQDHLQRIQMQYNNAIIFMVYDSIDGRRQKLFKEIHKSLVINGDYVKYTSISETLLFDYSYDNKLLQLVDFVAGSIRNTLVSIIKKDNNNYKKSVEFFKNYIYPSLAKDKNGNMWGIGLKETPKNDDFRKDMKLSLEEIIESV